MINLVYCKKLVVTFTINMKPSIAKQKSVHRSPIMISCIIYIDIVYIVQNRCHDDIMVFQLSWGAQLHIPRPQVEDHDLLRFLVARKWSVQAAVEQFTVRNKLVARENIRPQSQYTDSFVTSKMIDIIRIDGCKMFKVLSVICCKRRTRSKSCNRTLS